MAENTTHDLLSVNVDSLETKTLNSTAVFSLKSAEPDGEIVFSSTTTSIPGFIADTSSFAYTASTAPSYLPLAGGTITGNLTVTGTTTFNDLVVNTSSYSSGSTIFGDSLADTHQFTGSVSVTGSVLTWNNSTLIASNVTSSMSVASASQALTASFLQGTASNALSSLTASKISISNLASDPGTYYPMFANNASGPVSLFADASTYTYQPSTNILTVTSSLSLGVSASSINSNDSTTYDTSNINSINWDLRKLLDTAGNGVLDWAGYAAVDSSGNTSIDWENRDLYDENFKLSIKYNNNRREMYDGTGVDISLNWGNRGLVDSNVSTTLDWSTADTITINNALQITPSDPLPTGNLGMLSVSGSSLYFHNGSSWRLIKL